MSRILYYKNTAVRLIENSIDDELFEWPVRGPMFTQGAFLGVDARFLHSNEKERTASLLLVA
jgi:hypothetical protein